MAKDYPQNNLQTKPELFNKIFTLPSSLSSLENMT